MNNTEQSHYNRLIMFDAFLTQNAAKYAGNVAFTLFRAKVAADLVKVNATAAAAGANNSGFSQTRLDAKKIMSEEASLLSGNAYVHFDEIGRTDLSAALHINYSDYFGLADPAAAALAQAAHDLMDANLGLLDPDYVTGDNLKDLQTAIDNFNKDRKSVV